MSGTFIGKFLNKWTLSEKHKIAVSLKTTIFEDISFVRLSAAMK